MFPLLKPKQFFKETVICISSSVHAGISSSIHAGDAENSIVVIPAAAAGIDGMAVNVVISRIIARTILNFFISFFPFGLFFLPGIIRKSTLFWTDVFFAKDSDYFVIFKNKDEHCMNILIICLHSVLFHDRIRNRKPVQKSVPFWTGICFCGRVCLG